MISNRDDTIRIDTKSFEYITKLILIEKNELFLALLQAFHPEPEAWTNCLARD